MVRRARHKREVELFNFSFLDILACVIGLLIFILSIVVVSAGQTQNKAIAERLSNAEHRLQQANSAALQASERLRDLEQAVSQQSRDYADPQTATAAVKGEITLFTNEAARLDAAAMANQAKIDSVKQAQVTSGMKPTENPETSALQDQLRDLDEKTADLQQQAAEERKRSQQNVRQVQYYIPHVRPVDKSVFWVEISGDRFWCLRSDDYTSLPLGDRSIEFTRLPGAIGTSVSAMITGNSSEPTSLASLKPETTVLEVVVHPNGFEAYRKLRQWAWEKGFSINWFPHDESSIVLTHGHAVEQ